MVLINQKSARKDLEGRVGIELTHKGFADHPTSFVDNFPFNHIYCYLIFEGQLRAKFIFNILEFVLAFLENPDKKQTRRAPTLHTEGASMLF